VAIEYRWDLGQYERLPDRALDLARHRVAVIAATGGLPSVRTAKAATSEIPIVFTIAFGLVASLNRPGRFTALKPRNATCQRPHLSFGLPTRVSFTSALPFPLQIAHVL
jgi:hypothetical protein